MLEFERYDHLTAMPTVLARSYLTAASRTAMVLTSHALLVWSGLLAASVPRLPVGLQAEGLAAATTFLMPGERRMSVRATLPERGGTARIALEQPAQQTAPSYSAFRSAGGHATAQVIIAEDPSDPVAAALLQRQPRPNGASRA